MGINMDNKINSFSFKQYKNWTMKNACMRPGALEMLEKPSRMTNTLFYPNGETKYDPKSN